MFKRRQAFLRRLVELQEAERREIARELHDRVGQTLVALRINMHMVRSRLDEHDDPAIRGRNEESIELVESAFKSVQDVMYGLRPPMLDDHGLVASLEWHAKEVGRRSGLRIDVLGRADLRASADVELALFRIAQEALANVARHAGAKSVTIDVSTDAKSISLAIEDDGVGFSGEDGLAERAGFGFISMRERAEAIDGTFAIASDEGKGTRIVVTVPLDLGDTGPDL